MCPARPLQKRGPSSALGDLRPRWHLCAPVSVGEQLSLSQYTLDTDSGWRCRYQPPSTSQAQWVVDLGGGAGLPLSAVMAGSTEGHE